MRPSRHADVLVSEYYEKAVLEVDHVPRREFAILSGSFMRRHLQFNNLDALRKVLVRDPPTALYASLSRYLDPSARKAKGDQRKSRTCQECGHTCSLASVEEYSTIDDNSEKEKGWYCPTCDTINTLDSETSAKDQKAMDLAFDIDYGDIPGTANMTPVRKLAAASRSAYNLYVLLTQDFGVAEEDISITFSGGKGMHIRVSGGSLFSLGEPERKALVNYVSGYKFTFGDFLNIRSTPMGSNTWHLKAYQGGWGKRFNDSVAYFIGLAKQEGEAFDQALEMYWPWHETKDKYGQKKSLPSEKVRTAFKEACAEADFVLRGGDIRKMKDAEAKRLLNLALARARLRFASFVDKTVTSDKARVLRIPGSMHGKSGMVCCRVQSPEHLKNISWLQETQKELIGEDEITVELPATANTFYGVFEPGTHTLPRYQALAALCSVKEKM